MAFTWKSGRDMTSTVATGGATYGGLEFSGASGGLVVDETGGLHSAIVRGGLIFGAVVILAALARGKR